MNHNESKHTHHSHVHHHHGHSHGHEELSTRSLLLVTLLNLTITVAEFIGGFLANSLALLSDAVHNLGDTIAIVLAYIANRVSKRQANEQKTFGYKRIEIIAALFNSLVLIVIIIFLFREAYVRFFNPEPIKGLVMFIVATIGLLANLFSVVLLKSHSGHNINIKAAYLHLLGDTISSVAVIIGSILIYFFEIPWVDPLITILIGIYILKETFGILKETLSILMQSTPKSLSIPEIQNKLEQIEGVDNIHHVHIWNLNDSQIYFECHAELTKDLKLSETTAIYEEMKEKLSKGFHIYHITIQFGYNCCNEKDLIRKIAHSTHQK